MYWDVISLLPTYSPKTISSQGVLWQRASSDVWDEVGVLGGQALPQEGGAGASRQRPAGPAPWTTSSAPSAVSHHEYQSWPLLGFPLDASRASLQLPRLRQPGCQHPGWALRASQSPSTSGGVQVSGGSDRLQLLLGKPGRRPLQASASWTVRSSGAVVTATTAQAWRGRLGPAKRFPPLQGQLSLSLGEKPWTPEHSLSSGGSPTPSGGCCEGQEGEEAQPGGLKLAGGASRGGGAGALPNPAWHLLSSTLIWSQDSQRGRAQAWSPGLSAGL